MDAGGTGSSRDLSAPEAYILLHGLKGGPEGTEEAFKLALVELAARGWIATEEETEDTDVQAGAFLRRGEADFSPRARPLSAAFSIFEEALSRSEGEVEEVQAAEVRRAAEERYGSKLSAFAEEEVLPALESRGLYERADDKILGLIPREGWRETETGGRARLELERTTEEARENFPGWTRKDPDRALSFLGTAGPAALLIPSLYPQAAVLYGGAAGSGGFGEDAEEMAGFGEGSLEPSAFEGLSGLSGSLDVAFSEDLTSGLFASSFLEGMFGDPGGGGFGDGGGGFGGDGGGGGGP